MSSPVGKKSDTAEIDSEDLHELVRSLDKSRKRNLSEGLVRGDLVADRLVVQESSASPCFKKSKPASGMALTKADLYACIDRQTTKLTTRIDSVDESISVLRSDLTIVNRNVKSNAEKIENQAAAIKANLDRICGLETDVRRMRDAPAPPPAPRAVPGPAHAPQVNEEEYLLARRSLRLWPVDGQDEEMWRLTGEFIASKLCLQVTEDKIEDVYRPSMKSGPGVLNEVVVVFVLASTRDMVMGASAKLAPYVDGSGKPTAGIRIQVPSALKSHFGVLFRYGQVLRTRHGIGFRRHIKFNDIDRALFLNVKLPGDETWSRVSYEVARRGLRARETLRDNDLERRLDVNGPSAAGRPRASSESSVPMLLDQPAPTTAPWTGRRSSARE